MNDVIFPLISEYGIWIIWASTYLSCLAIPMPSSLMMLVGGAFAAAGDLALLSTAGAAFTGAVLGDQTGFLIGRLTGKPVSEFLGRKPARAAVLARAEDFVDKRGGLGVFFSTWLVAPLGPWVNLVAGATKLGWMRFTLWDVAGEVIWVSAYTGLGYSFASQIELVASLLGNSVGFLAAGVVTVILGVFLRDAIRRFRKSHYKKN